MNIVTLIKNNKSYVKYLLLLFIVYYTFELFVSSMLFLGVLTDSISIRVFPISFIVTILIQRKFFPFFNLHIAILKNTIIAIKTIETIVYAIATFFALLTSCL